MTGTSRPLFSHPKELTNRDQHGRRRCSAMRCYFRAQGMPGRSRSRQACAFAPSRSYESQRAAGPTNDRRPNSPHLLFNLIFVQKGDESGLDREQNDYDHSEIFEIPEGFVPCLMLLESSILFMTGINQILSADTSSAASY